MRNDIYFMEVALKEAKKAYKIGEVPVGCVLVNQNNKIIAKAYNKKEKLHDVCGHAEILCIKKASKKIGDWRLNDLTLYVTLEPCLMCSSAIIQSRIKRIVFGAYEQNTGAVLSRIHAFKMENSSCLVDGGILEEDCKKVIQDFFKEKRKK